MTITKQRTMENSSPGDVVKAIMTVLERHSAMSVKEIMRELQLRRWPPHPVCAS